MTEWFRRKTAKITTFNKKDIEEGKWQKCSNCGEVLFTGTLIKKYYICSNCNYHLRMPSYLYKNLLLDNVEEEIGADLVSKDILKFRWSKKYSDQIEKARELTSNNDAIRVYVATINDEKCVVGIMNFAFIGGSLGSVVGQKISLGIDYASQNNLPLIIVCSSGGARMQEGVISLMQLAKISTRFYFQKERFVHFHFNRSYYGGVTASYAMQADIILSEPNALIGFAGARVIKQTIGQDLPEGFQRAEFLLKKGFIDSIVSRVDMKKSIYEIMKIFQRR